MNKIQKLTTDLTFLVDETTEIVNNLTEAISIDNDDVSLKHERFIEFLTLMIERLSNYKLILQRNYLKCVFIGRTSNGKSSTINALLKQVVVPSGIGHTTNCFISIRSTEREEPYIEHYTYKDTEVPKAVMSMENVRQLSSALSPTKVDCKDTIMVHYPGRKCQLIGPNIYVLDTPGIDIDLDFDSMIDSHCLDADVFVLVCNAESVLMQCEKNFFLKVRKRYCIPNILVVNNRWDVADESDVDELERVRSQQMKIFSDFLVKELKICSESEVKSKVFFISALEEVKIFTQQESFIDCRGRTERSREFLNFEKSLKDILSEKALNQKIKSHLKALEQTFDEINAFVNCLFNTIIVEKEIIKKSYVPQAQYLRNLESDIVRVQQKAAHLIESSVIKAKEKIIYDFRNLVCDLDLSVDTVKLTFNPYNKREYLDYQKILIENVENSLNVNLKEKTMTSVNSLLKIGIEKLTKIYCELLASRPNPHINEKTTTGCQNAVLHIYPEFSIIMNKKIADVTDLIPKIPPHLLTMEKCLSTLNSIDNRFSSYVGSRMHLNETGYAGGYNAATRQPIISSSSSSLTARYPEMELMIPRFSTVIMTDFKYSPGFKFSLSPNSVRILAHNWSSTNCPVRSKARLIGRPLLAFSVILAGTGYAVVVTNFRYTRHAVAVLLGCYGLMYVMERSRWDSDEEMLSLKDQFITHSKFKMETIIVISAATTARQLGSYLHLDLKGLHSGCENIIINFKKQVEFLTELDKRVSVNEKNIKKIKLSLYSISQQIGELHKVLNAQNGMLFS